MSYRRSGNDYRIAGPASAFCWAGSADGDISIVSCRRLKYWLEMEGDMRWIRYEADGRPVYGILDGDMVTEVRGDPFAGYEKTTTRRPLSSVKLLVPVEPRTFYCAGLNYAEHVIEAAKKRGETPKLPEAADIGYRANNALTADGEPIWIPSDATERGQYQGWLV